MAKSTFAELPLNAEQRQAAMHLHGPALVLAGPGTGKTTTLVGRYCFLLEQGVSPKQIFTVTFTRRAAQQLKDRIGQLTSADTKRLPIGTFHSRCFHLLGQLGYRLDADAVLSEDGARLALLRELKLHEVFELEELLSAFDRFKSLLLSPADVLRGKVEGLDQELAKLQGSAFQLYQNALSQRQLYDFGDLIALAVQSLQQNSELRQSYASQYMHVMIDEFQDVNPAQSAFIDGLLVSHQNIWVVGDDDQAIYGWRGGDVRLITDFTRRFANAKVVQLSKNYRSGAAILQAATHLIEHNRDRLPKTVEVINPDSSPITVCTAEDEYAEARFVVAKIKALQAQGVRLDTIAILVRAKYITLPLEGALEAAGIPFTLRGGGALWNRPVVKTLVNVIAQVAKHERSANFPRLFSIGYLEPILLDAAQTLSGKPFGPFVEHLAAVARSKMPRSVTPEDEVAWKNSTEEVSRIAAACGSAKAFLDHVETSLRHQPETEAVTLSTIHQAKGLEWAIVFLAACETDILPSYKSDDRREERRLAFVAATRTRQKLFVSAAQRRGGRASEPSPFIDELTATLPDSMVSRTSYGAVRNGASAAHKPLAAGSKPAPSGTVRSYAQTGDRVEHPSFGEGVIRRVNGDKIEVAFPKGGIRILLASFLKHL